MRFECWDCKAVFDQAVAKTDCPFCGSEWIEPVYDYEGLVKAKDSVFIGETRNLWRYKKLLPISSDENIVSFNEGWTPLRQAKNLGLKYKIDLYIKDEGIQPPTYTFKNRGAALAVSGLKQEGHSSVALYSTGNIGVAFSYYCQKAAIRLYAFFPRDTPQEKINEVRNNGAEAIVVNGTYAEAQQRCKDFAAEHSIYMDRGAKSIYRRASKKTVAFELYEQLGSRAPGFYFQSVSGGIGPLGVYTAFRELMTMGLVDRLPKICCVQVDGCNPMYQSFLRDTEEITVIPNPATVLVTLATGIPMSYPYVYRVVKATDGIIESVREDECYRMAELLLDEEGVESSPASLAALVGIVKLASLDYFKKDDGPVIFVSTGRK